jgi:signal transduction histidine kinase
VRASRSKAASFNEAAGRVEALVDSHRRLLANASHELRSPLARMRLGVELLSQQPTPQRRADLARDIAELDALIDEILTASRLDSGAELVREAVDLTALVAEEAARHGVVIEAPALSCEGNHRLLQRLVRNLLDNAQHYGGGSIEVQLRSRAEAIEIDVMDRGPGVPAVERERVFDPFYRLAGASEAHGGVGLGLALVRQIARQHGGDAVCQARDGGGSVFRVTLPPAGAAVSRPASPAPVPSLPPAAA